MRKEEEPEELPAAADEKPQPSRGRMEAETELEDKDLLGAATLAKLSPAQSEENLGINEEDVPEA
jgi:hypothetical protein